MTTERRYLLDLAREKAYERLDDDFTYPQRYFHQIVSRNESVIQQFTDDYCFSDEWENILAEAYEDGVQFSRADLADIAEEVITDLFVEWGSLSAEEQAEIIGA